MLCSFLLQLSPRLLFLFFHYAPSFHFLLLLLLNFSLLFPLCFLLPPLSPALLLCQYVCMTVSGSSEHFFLLLLDLFLLLDQPCRLLEPVTFPRFGRAGGARGRHLRG